MGIFYSCREIIKIILGFLLHLFSNRIKFIRRLKWTNIYEYLRKRKNQKKLQLKLQVLNLSLANLIFIKGINGKRFFVLYIHYLMSCLPEINCSFYVFIVKLKELVNNVVLLNLFFKLRIMNLIWKSQLLYWRGIKHLTLNVHVINRLQLRSRFF